MLFRTSKSTGMWSVQCLLFRVDHLFTLKRSITFFKLLNTWKHHLEYNRIYEQTLWNLWSLWAASCIWKYWCYVLPGCCQLPETPDMGHVWSMHFVHVAWKRGEGKQRRNTMTQDQVLSFWLGAMCLHTKTTQFYSPEVRKVWVAWANPGAHLLSVYSLTEQQDELQQSVCL